MFIFILGYSTIGDKSYTWEKLLGDRRNYLRSSNRKS